MEYVVGGIVSISASLIALRFYNRYKVWGHFTDMLPERSILNAIDMRDKTIIVTGANSGIGKEITRELYQQGARVIMACRNADDCQRAIEDIKNFSRKNSHKNHNSLNKPGELIYRHLDLLSLESVRSFVTQINCKEPTIHILINNAAIYNDPVEITKDGFERNMQINHLAPALLTLSLVPKLSQINNLEDEDNSELNSEGEFLLKQRINCNKIIFVSSTLYRKGTFFEEIFQPFISNENLKTSKNFSSYCSNVYSNTKLANLLFARQLSLKNDFIRGINIAIASPGFALTRLHRNLPKSRLLLMSLLTPILIPFLRSSREAAQTIIGCALMKETQSDVLYRNCKSDLKLIFDDPSLANKVYQSTLDCLKPYFNE